MERDIAGFLDAVRVREKETGDKVQITGPKGGFVPLADRLVDLFEQTGWDWP